MPSSPINEILQMRQQGLSNNQIIQNLQRMGYSNTQIFDAMNQADTKMAVEGVQTGFLQQPGLFTQPEFLQHGEFIPNEAQPIAEQTFVQPQVQEISQQSFSQRPEIAELMNINQTQVKIEELVEAIIEEKWSELLKDISKIVDWKNKVESRIQEIEIKLETLQTEFSDLNKAIIGKVNEYDKHILEIGTDIKAMEKAFSKVLPIFTENVNELSRITKKIKGEEK